MSASDLPPSDPRARRGRGRRRTLFARLRRTLGLAILFLLLSPVALIVLYRYVDPPITPLMIGGLIDGRGLERQSVPLARISPHLQRAVIAAEDNRFCQHHGIDWPALKEQIAVWAEGERPRGASTISMQTAKNILLWPERDPFRKVLEIPLTAVIELLWPKRRILEVYLNVIETGSGRYGAEAAAQAYFGRPAAELTRGQAALIATALPAPRHRAPAAPSPRHRALARRIEGRIDSLGASYFACLADP